MMLLLLSSGLLDAVPSALAALPPLPDCTGLAGCGGPSANVLVLNAGRIAQLLLRVAGGVASFFVVWCAINMIVYSYDSGKVAGYRYGVLYALAGLALSGSAQLIIGWVLTVNYGGSNLPLDILATSANALYTVLNAVFALSLVIGGIRMVIAQGQQDQFSAGRSTVIWSIIGAVIANAAAILVRAVAGYLGV